MKKFYLLALIMTLVGSILHAQAPQGFNYQAVVRNSSGHIVSNQEVNVRLNILQGSETGTSVYSYTGHVMSNQNGVITIVVGENSTQYAAIDWANGPYFLQSEIDINNGTDFDLSTTQQILSVPYAQHAAVADRVSSAFIANETDPLFTGWGYLYDSLINAPTRLSQFINDVNFLTANDIQLTLSGDTLFISGGSYVVLPHNMGNTTIYWDSIINHPDSLSQFINNLKLSDFYNDLNLSDFNNDLNLSDFNNDLNLSDFNNDLNMHVSGDTIFFGDSFVTINGATTINWDSIIGHPDSLSQFINNLKLSDFFNDLNLSDFNNDLNVHVSGDTIFFGDSFVTINGATTIDWDSVVGRPTNLSQFFNDLNLSDFNNDLNIHVNGDTIFFGDSFVTINGATTIDWDSVINHPTNLSEFNNDLNLSDFNNDLNLSDFNNDMNFHQSGDTIFFGDIYVTVDDSIANARIDLLNLRIDSLLNVIDSLSDRLAESMTINDSLNSTVDSLVHPTTPGLLPGKFSIGPNRIIQFSKGNLQYKPKNKIFRFANNQYDIGSHDQISMGSTCPDWIDLFPFGTSGWEGGRQSYMPYETNTNDYFYIFTDGTGDLTGDNANGDWGIYNPIINGGNQMATWRTLTSTEWNYILNLRSNASNLKTFATVYGMKGLILLPDSWTGSSMTITLTSYETNNYSESDWLLLEAAGAVFLPVAGRRDVVTVNGTSSWGYYWSSSRVPGQYQASAVHISTESDIAPVSTDCHYGCSVRLVRDY